MSGPSYLPCPQCHAGYSRTVNGADGYTCNRCGRKFTYEEAQATHRELWEHQEPQPQKKEEQR